MHVEYIQILNQHYSLHKYNKESCVLRSSLGGDIVCYTVLLNTDNSQHKVCGTEEYVISCKLSFLPGVFPSDFEVFVPKYRFLLIWHVHILSSKTLIFPYVQDGFTYLSVLTIFCMNLYWGGLLGTSYQMRRPTFSTNAVAIHHIFIDFKDHVCYALKSNIYIYPRFHWLNQFDIPFHLYSYAKTGHSSLPSNIIHVEWLPH